VKIRFAHAAEISLYSAIDNIRQDNPTAAAGFLKRIALKGKWYFS